MMLGGKMLRHVPVLALLLAVTLVYYPGLHGPFVLDDNENILSNRSVAINQINLDSLQQAMLGNDSGPFKRPLAALSFAFNYYFAGGFGSSFWFKFTNLCLHLVNTLLIYLLALTLMRSPVLGKNLAVHEVTFTAVVTTALWALHPIQLTNILYVVQRMNSMSALFVISGLILFARGRQLVEINDRRGMFLMLCGTLIGLIPGIASKENAVLLPLYALAIEFTLYRRTQLNRDLRKSLLLLYSAMLLIPAILFVIYSIAHPGFLHEAYLGRGFTVVERVMTEARVLWFYIGLILVPDIHRFGLFHDDIPISTALLTPPNTLPSVLGIGALIVFAIVKRKQYPVIGFAILWFLFGHSLESSIFGLEIAFEHRNYLPSFGVFLAIGYSSNHLHMTTGNLRKLIRIALPVLILMVSVITWSMANVWRDAYSLAEENVRNHPDSPRANDMAARVNLEKGNIIKSIGYLQNGARAAPDEVGFRIDMRIVLTALANKINKDIKHAVSSGASHDRVDIKGLPDNITSAMADGSIRLLPRNDTKNSMKNLLQTKAISSHGIMSLDYLHDCILNPPYTCAPLYDEALSWFTTAATNHNTEPEYQALIFADTATLVAWKRNYKKALEYIRPATRIDQNRLYYRLLEADYLIHLGQTANAKSVVDRIENDKTRYRLELSYHQDMYDRLLKQLGMHEAIAR